MKTLWALLEWWRDYRLERLRLEARATNAPYEAIQAMVERLSQSNTASTDVLKSWLEGFTKNVETGTTTVRDEDEVRMELERLGFAQPALHESIDIALKTGNIAELRDIMGDLE